MEAIIGLRWKEENDKEQGRDPFTKEREGDAALLIG